MSSLRSKVIRLAHQQPALRPHLLPLLTRTAGSYPRIEQELKEDYARKAITSGEYRELLSAIENAETERDAQKIVADHRKGRVAAKVPVSQRSPNEQVRYYVGSALNALGAGSIETAVEYLQKSLVVVKGPKFEGESSSLARSLSNALQAARSPNPRSADALVERIYRTLPKA